jgi:hypothetical protein
MLPLETKQSGGKLLPHSILRGGGGSVPGGSTTQQAKEYIQEVGGGYGDWM